MTNNLVKKAVKKAGGPGIVASECGVSKVAVWKWMDNGHLPRSDWTGETNYASVIERLANDEKFSRDRLLATRKKVNKSQESRT